MEARLLWLSLSAVGLSGEKMWVAGWGGNGGKLMHSWCPWIWIPCVLNMILVKRRLLLSPGRHMLLWKACMLLWCGCPHLCNEGRIWCSANPLCDGVAAPPSQLTTHTHPNTHYPALSLSAPGVYVKALRKTITLTCTSPSDQSKRCWQREGGVPVRVSRARLLWADLIVNLQPDC